MFKLSTTALISQASKYCSKFSKPGFNSTWTVNSQMLKLDLQKAEEPEIDQIANIRWIIERAREFQKNIYFCFLDYAKAFVWITINWKILEKLVLSKLKLSF